MLLCSRLPDKKLQSILRDEPYFLYVFRVDARVGAVGSLSLLCLRAKLQTTVPRRAKLRFPWLGSSYNKQRYPFTACINGEHGCRELGAL